mgnify:CR=1 FL=1
MDRGGLNNPQNIKIMSEELDKYNYYSMLLTYHSKNSDLLIKSLLAANNDINLKFMLAIRTYAISPEYLSMICNSYNQSFPNKLILNVTSGDIHLEENSVNDIPMFSEYLDTPEKRLNYTEEWTKKFIEICSNRYLPELFMAGHSDKTREMADKFNATHISMLDMHIKYLKDNNIINKKQLISLSILIRDNFDKAKEFLLKNNTAGAENWTLVGNTEKIKKEILDLQNLGITDILISQCPNDDQIHLVHELIKELSE